MSHTIKLEITAESQNHAESLVHEIRKQADEASRYGVDVSIDRIPEETEHEADFSE